jgi:hypothetical protein
MPAPHRILAVTASAAGALAFAAPAIAAPTLTTDACVRSVASLGGGKTMSIAATGFTPGSNVTIKYASKIDPTPEYLTSGMADATGSYAALVEPPLFHKFDTQEQDFLLGATDDVNPALTATTPFHQVRFGYELKPDHARPSAKVQHTVRGFANGQPVYIHYRYHGQTKKTVSLGVTSSPCGIATKKMAFLPVKPAHNGKWNLYIDQAKKFSLKTPLQLRTALSIFTTFK